jgi:hypothetical protein
MKTIYRDFDHYWSSASRDLAKEIWDDFEPTIIASREDYKNTYATLLKKKEKESDQFLTALLEYVETFHIDSKPSFWRWYLDREDK